MYVSYIERLASAEVEKVQVTMLLIYHTSEF